MVKQKWTERKVLEVIAEARKAGQVTADEKLAKLQGKGPRFAVCEGDEVVGTMLDVCGFANLKISARGKFFQLAKKLAVNPSARFFCVNGYYGGGSLSIFDSTCRQEMSVNIAACNGQAKVLAKYGVGARVESRID